MTDGLVEYSGNIYCDSCGFAVDSVPDGETWVRVKDHVLANPGHRVEYEITVSKWARTTRAPALPEAEKKEG